MSTKINIENILKKGVLYMIPLFFLLFSFGSEFFKFFVLVLFFPALTLLLIYFKKYPLKDNFKFYTYEKLIVLFVLLSFFSSMLSQNKFSAFFGDFNNHLFSFLTIFFSVVLFLLLARAKDLFSLKDKFLKVFLYSSIGLFVYKIVTSFIPAFNFFKFTTEDLIIIASLNILLFAPLFFGNFFSKSQNKFVKYFLLLLFFLITIVFHKPLFFIFAIAFLIQGMLIDKKILLSSFRKRFSLLIVIVFFFGIILSIGSENVYKIGEENLNRSASFKIVLSSIKTDFLFGVGLGSYSDYLSLHRPYELNYEDNWQLRFKNSHSFVCNLPPTVGFLASVSFILFLAFLLYISYKSAVLYKKKDNDYQFISSLGAFVFVVFLPFLTIFSFLSFLLFWFFLALFLNNVLSSGYYKNSGFLIRNTNNIFQILFYLAVFMWFLIIAFSVKFLIADVYSKNINEESIQKAIYFNPSFEEYPITLSKIYLERAKLELKNANKDYGAIARDVDEAKKWAEKAIAINPNSVISYETLGIIYRDIANYSSNGEVFAIGPLVKAFSLEPTNPVLATEIGKLYLLQGDKVNCEAREGALGCNENALKYFNIAHSLKSDYSDASLGLAKVMIVNNNNREAIDLLEKLKKDEFSNSKIYFELGRAYFNMNNDRLAIENFQKSLLFDSNNSNALYSLAITYDRMGDKESAFLYYKKTQDLNPGNLELMQKINEFE
ncbi:MAG: hypothetical protein PF572_02855 [Patescibacteria group bacterium]|jgi:Flp pilus assembly protein TadD/O-antigen ligase|nr:hypothetical protein [Patescibacteria group bacterium]